MSDESGASGQTSATGMSTQAGPLGLIAAVRSQRLSLMHSEVKQEAADHVRTKHHIEERITVEPIAFAKGDAERDFAAAIVTYSGDGERRKGQRHCLVIVAARRNGVVCVVKDTEPTAHQLSINAVRREARGKIVSFTVDYKIKPHDPCKKACDQKLTVESHGDEARA